MESLMRKTLTGRLLAAGLLAGVLTLAWLERRSALAQALAAGRPVLGWLALGVPGNAAHGAPALFLGIYQPATRTLDLVHVPSDTRASGHRSLATAYDSALTQGVTPPGAVLAMTEAAGDYLTPLVPGWTQWGSLPVWQGDCPPLSDEPPLDAARWFSRRARAPLLWLKDARGPTSSGADAPAWPGIDHLLLALEFLRLDPRGVRPAWLAQEDQVGSQLTRLILRDSGPAASEHVTVEVLNASARPGIASHAKNILRLRGADVMSVGNAPGAPTHTLVYDRTGRFENAAAVAGMLDCPAAQAISKVDLRLMVDVTVVLAEDCPLQ
jgi:hypothetical protein